MSVIRALNIAASGLDVTEKNFAISSQNLAGQQVDSYKKVMGVSLDLPYFDLQEPGAATGSTGGAAPLGKQVGSGVFLAGTYRSFAEGDIHSTDEPFDLAIKGNGFYQVILPDGKTAYTRVAIFQKDSQGNIVTSQGYALQPAINIPANSEAISVTKDGKVEVQVAGQTAFQTVGQIQLSTFVNPNGLKATGDGMYLETEASGTATIGAPQSDVRGEIWQGYRELSNVNTVEEFTGLIKLQHIYESLTKVITTGDAMWEASNRVGR